jgi:hypothetical protein
MLKKHGKMVYRYRRNVMEQEERVESGPEKLREDMRFSTCLLGIGTWNFKQNRNK